MDLRELPRGQTFSGPTRHRGTRVKEAVLDPTDTDTVHSAGLSLAQGAWSVAVQERGRERCGAGDGSGTSHDTARFQTVSAVASPPTKQVQTLALAAPAIPGAGTTSPHIITSSDQIAKSRSHLCYPGQL